MISGTFEALLTYTGFAGVVLLAAGVPVYFLAAKGGRQTTGNNSPE